LPVVKSKTVVKVGYVAVFLGFALAGLVGDSHAAAIYAIPAGVVLAAGAAYVALNVGRVAEDLGEENRRAMERGLWWDRLALALYPDQVRRTKVGAWSFVFFGLVLLGAGLFGVVAAQ
jgi:hypothetical protein